MPCQGTMAQPLEEGSLSPKHGMSHYAGNTLVTAPTKRDVGEAQGSVINTMRERGSKIYPWRAQQSRTVKWECCISVQAKPGPHKISVLQETIAQIGLSNATQPHLEPLRPAWAQEAPTDEHLSSEQTACLVHRWISPIHQEGEVVDGCRL